MWPGLLETRPGGRPGEEGAAGLLLLLLAHQPPSPIHHRRSPRLRLCQGSPIPTLPLNPGQVPREHQHHKLALVFNQARSNITTFSVWLFLHNKAQRPSHLLTGGSEAGGDGNVSLTRTPPANIEVAQQARTQQAPIKS